MSNKEVCENCKYYNGSICRALPPVTMDTERIDPYSYKVAGISYHPKVKSDNFCMYFTEE